MVMNKVVMTLTMIITSPVDPEGQLYFSDSGHGSIGMALWEMDGNCP